MRLNRALRLLRWMPVAAVVAAAACEHGDVNQLITLDGDTLILNVSMSTQFAGGVPAGTRVVNRFLATAFDTSLADAFTRSSTSAANLRADPNGTACYGATQLIHFAATKVSTYTPPARYLPAITAPATAYNVGCGGATAYIVQGGHPGNGTGNTVWEFWQELQGVTAGTRYVMGLARYALEQRGALDIAEILLTGAVTQPDTLVFRTGDFVPGGRKAVPTFTTSCANANIVQPVAGANPHLLASGVASAGGTVSLDQTACSNTASAWFNGLGNANSPVPANGTTALGTRQYNFLVVWEALADSTPDYTKPVYRVQIGPVMTTAGVVINNGFAPVPAAGLTAAQQALLTGATSRPDTVTMTATNLAPLTNASYQVWFTQGGTTSAALATGRFDRLVNNVVVDSNLSTDSFNPAVTDTAGSVYRMKIDFAAYSTLAAFDAGVLVVAPAGGSTTVLPAVQPLWAGVSNKLPGKAAPALSSALTFGNFDNGGASSFRWAPVGNGTGGVFGRSLDVQVYRLQRPPVGYYYNAYLRNSISGAMWDLGTITGPFPDYATLIDADVNATGPVNEREVVQAAFRWQDTSTIQDTVLTGNTSQGDFGAGTTVPATWNTTVCQYDLIQVRLEPKTRAVTAPTVTIQGTNPRRTSTYCAVPVQQ